MLAEKTTCWILTEGIAGTENQCLGVADFLGIKPDIKRISLRQPWKTFSPPLLKSFSWSFYPKLQPPWPDILIASGRKSVAASVYIKQQSRGHTFTAQIQDPKIAPKHFDLVAVPYHDDLRGENVVVTDGAPNRVTNQKLQAEKAGFQDWLSPLPAPRVAVLIGGRSKAYQVSKEDIERLVHSLKCLENMGCGLMITASRRTGEDNIRYLRESFRNSHSVFFWDGNGKNPYFGYLAWADHIIVSEDSVSMISEAATTGKPVYRFPLTGGARRLNKFHKHLEEKNVVKEFRGKLEDWTYAPLDDSRKVANELITRLRAKARI